MIANGFHSPDHVIEILGVTRQFGAKRALDNVSLAVPRGVVFGLVGANGAGKTTLIRHVLGLLKAQTGSVRVFGLDPVKDPVGVLSRVGYLSEDGDLPGWMRVDELIRYMRAFYPSWDESYAQDLRRRFDLDPAAKVKTLSKGQKARAGLLVALAYRPELLLLDEPSSGLDPIVRRDILGAIVRTIADEGRTVLFSSHLLDEVERISDRVAMLKGGHILFTGEIDEIKSAHHRLTLRFDDQRNRPPALEGVLSWEGRGCEWTAVACGRLDALKLAASAMGAAVVQQQGLSLDEIFLAQVGKPTAPAEEALP
ncbi:MAG: ABC transporter ATP-binding protein [Thermoguttaceae bacterium]|jgi:ABC-2 type transport system ATP-binding protein